MVTRHPDDTGQQVTSSPIDPIIEQVDRVHELLEEFLRGRSSDASADPTVHTLSETITNRVQALRERVRSLESLR